MSELDRSATNVQRTTEPKMSHRPLSSQSAAILNSNDDLLAKSSAHHRDCEDSPPVAEVFYPKGASSPDDIHAFPRKALNSNVIKIKSQISPFGLHNRSSCTITPDKNFRRKRPASSMAEPVNLIRTDFKCDEENKTRLAKTSEKELGLETEGPSLHSPVPRRPNPLCTPFCGSPSSGSLQRGPSTLPARIASAPSRWGSPSSFSRHCRDSPLKTLKYPMSRLTFISSAGPLEPKRASSPNNTDGQNGEDVDEEMERISTSPGMARFVQRASSLDSHLPLPTETLGADRDNSVFFTTSTSALSPSSETMRRSVPTINLTPKLMPRRCQEAFNIKGTELTSLPSAALAPQTQQKGGNRPAVPGNAQSPPPDQVSASSDFACPSTPRFGNPKTTCHVALDKGYDGKSYTSNVSLVEDFHAYDVHSLLLTSRRLGLKQETLLCEADCPDKGTPGAA